MANLSQQPITMYYKKREPREVSEELGLIQKNLELCTNFRHSPA